MNPKKRGLGRGLEALLASPSVESNNPTEGGSAELNMAGTEEGGVPRQTVIKHDATVDMAQHDGLTGESARAIITAVHQERLEILAEAYALLDLLDAFEKLVRSEELASRQVKD